MKFFRIQKSGGSTTAKSASSRSWVLRFNPFKRPDETSTSNEDTSQPMTSKQVSPTMISEPISPTMIPEPNSPTLTPQPNSSMIPEQISPNMIPEPLSPKPITPLTPLTTFSPLYTTPITTPSLSPALSGSSSPISEYSSRRSSVLSVMTDLPAVAPPIPPKSLDRQNSIYSQRSLSIKRDTTGPPPAIPRPPTFVRPLTASVEEEDCLILTATSKYPSNPVGMFGQENLSLESAQKQEKETRRAYFRSQISKNGAVIRRHSGIKTSEEKWRLKRCSVNF